jgi:hypothetical protein
MAARSRQTEFIDHDATVPTSKVGIGFLSRPARKYSPSGHIGVSDCAALLTDVPVVLQESRVMGERLCRRKSLLNFWAVH